MRKKTFFKIGRTLIKVKCGTTEISLKKVKSEQMKIENAEYERLRQQFNEDHFDIFKEHGDWFVKEKK